MRRKELQDIIDREFGIFVNFPDDQREFVTVASCKLFAEHVVGVIQPRPAIPEGYAGATVWIGDKRVTQVVTEETLKYERERGMAITNAAQACLDLLAAGRERPQ